MSVGVMVLFCFRTSNITKLSDINNSYSFDYQKNSYILYYISKRENGSDCIGVSTPGHGQRGTLARRDNGRDSAAGAYRTEVHPITTIIHYISEKKSWGYKLPSQQSVASKYVKLH